MIISKAYITESSQYARVCVDAFYENRMNIFWYEVDRQYKDFLCHEKNDAFVTALLYYCMVHSIDIYSLGDVSAMLLYQLNEIYIPALSNGVNEFNHIYIHANSNDCVLDSDGNVGTGYSGGVDSIYTILKNQEAEKNMKITCLTFFKNGFGGNSLYANELNEKRSQRFSKTVSEMGYPYIEVRTNIRYFMFFDPVTSLLTLAAALSIQKYIKHYLYSSSYLFSDFKFTPTECFFYDLLTVQCFSTENITFYSIGSDVERMAKLDYIKDFPIAQRNLDVCWDDLGNCMDIYCGKCFRTQLGLYVLGALEQFHEVFNVDLFLERIDRNIGQLLYQYRHEVFLQKIHEYLEESNFQVSVESENYKKILFQKLEGAPFPEKGRSAMYRKELWDSNDEELLKRIRDFTLKHKEFLAENVRINPNGCNMRWLRNEIECKSILNIFKEKGWKKVAIYGCGKVARNLVKCLCKGGITPAYIIYIDGSIDYCPENIKRIRGEDDWEDADITIVAKVFFEEIPLSIVDKLPQKTIYIENLIHAV